MEAVGPLGNPELHVAFGPGRDAVLAVPGHFVIRAVGPEQVRFLAMTVPAGLSVRLLLSGLAGGGFGEQEAVVGGDDDMVAVQVVDDVGHQAASSSMAFRTAWKVLSSVVASSPMASTVLW